MSSAAQPHVITIPSADSAFRSFVDRVRGETPPVPGELQRRLRRIFPRVVVHERTLSGEPSTWYVYRDGGWRSSGPGDWWREPSMPRIVVSADGFLAEVSPTAADLLGIEPERAAQSHFTDFIVPGTLEDSQALFGVIEQGGELNATILLRPTSGDIIAVDIHASRVGDAIVGVVRLADDVGDTGEQAPVDRPASVATVPETDVAFRAYVEGAISRMPEPTPDGLALRVRRLYPHASIAIEDGGWVVRRDPGRPDTEASPWWRDDSLPCIRYDSLALILEANDAAKQFFDRELVGHHWQEFVTPGSTEQVSVMLQILAEVGAAESRFRMPRGDGRLIEFDSYTTVHGDSFETVFRPVAGAAPAAD